MKAPHTLLPRKAAVPEEKNRELTHGCLLVREGAEQSRRELDRLWPELMLEEREISEEGSTEGISGALVAVLTVRYIRHRSGGQLRGACDAQV
jgi:hypothetical protein